MNAAVSMLHLHDLPEGTVPSDVLAAFDALAPGQALLVSARQDVRGLLRKVQGERPGRYDWNILEAGPERFRTEVRRRTSERPRSITEVLERDHRRLDALLEEVEALADAGSFPAAAERFAEFACGLDWHIDVEEHVLFPEFEERTGMTRGPTTVMASEHYDIRNFMSEVRRALERREGSDHTQALADLTELLAEHNAKEERMLYPMTDRAMGDDHAREDLVRRIEAF